MPESLFPGPGVFRISVSSKLFNLKHLSKIIMIELCLILSESLFPGPDMTILIHNFFCIYRVELNMAES
jgi:hypothetical protein